MNFDPHKANNNLLILPWSYDFKDYDILIALNKANESVLHLRWDIASLPNPTILLEFLSLRESIESNAIEQINTTMMDVLVAEQQDIKQIKKADKETINYKKWLLYGFKQIQNNNILTINDLVEINKLIIENDAWIISSPDKKIEKIIGSKKEVIYTPPQWLDTIHNLCSNLEKYINQFDVNKDIDPLLKLPIIHYQFEAIHPFKDWNWRVWRILMILFLVLSWKLDYPILFISEFIHKNKSDYYRLLHEIDIQWEKAIKPFLLYMLRWLTIQSAITSKLVYKIKNLMLDTEKHIQESDILSKVYSKELIEYLFSHPIYSIKTYMNLFKVTRHTASKHLQLLAKSNICSLQKMKKVNYYVNDEYLKIILWV